MILLATNYEYLTDGSPSGGGTKSRLFFILLNFLDINFGEKSIFYIVSFFLIFFLITGTKNYLKEQHDIRFQLFKTPDIVYRIGYPLLFLFLGVYFIRLGNDNIKEYPSNVNDFKRVNGVVDTIFFQSSFNSRGIEQKKLFLIIGDDSCFVTSTRHTKHVSAIEQNIKIGDTIYLWYQDNDYKFIESIMRTDRTKVIEYDTSLHIIGLGNYFVGGFWLLLFLFLSSPLIFRLIKKWKE